ncbi:MAG: DUF2283 domain-containing protein [Snowella sp.]|nr:DUF2283 domain-containing protein [Snowella sp.]
MNNIEYDPVVDSAYFQLTDSIGIESEEITDGVIVDYDKYNNIVAIELLGVTTLSSNALKQLNTLVSPSALAQLQEWLPQLTTNKVS